MPVQHLSNSRPADAQISGQFSWHFDCSRIEKRLVVTRQMQPIMALAIHCDQMIREGKVANQTELARLLHVTQPRMTQIMNLLLLAPDIQEKLLFLPRVEQGEDPVTERDLRAVCAEVDWERQRGMWVRVVGAL